MPTRWVWATLVLTVLVAILALFGPLAAIAARWSSSANPVEIGSWAVVQRLELVPVVKVAGDLVSAQQTDIKIEVEDLRGSAPRSVFGQVPPMTIVELIPDGSAVEKGEVLCRLDATFLEELVRLQTIEVEHARAEAAQAAFELRTAQVVFREFEEGERVRRSHENEGAVALAQVDQIRADDHLRWTRELFRLGYLSAADRADDELAQARAVIELDRARVRQRTYQDYNVPKILRELRSRVEQAESTLHFAHQRRELEDARFDKLREQLELCTLRAPHDGFLIYADLHYRQYYQIREGAEVYQHQTLFHLPDLERMSVDVTIHETLAQRVKVGQRARVRVGAYPVAALEGRVASIDLLPTFDWRHWDEIPVFQARIDLDPTPLRLLPQMSAEVEILNDSAATTLAVPIEAVGVEDEHAYCLVFESGRIERRAVEFRSGTTDLVEILDGLEEGQIVLLRPWQQAGSP